MRVLRPIRSGLAWCLLLGSGAGLRAAEHVTLRNGFELNCQRREVVGDRVRLYLQGTGEAGYLEVAAGAVVRVEAVEDATEEKQVRHFAQGDRTTVSGAGRGDAVPAGPTLAEMLAGAGVQHRVDADLLASVVRAESGGRVGAVSRAGALGLMQLMPGTATAMGVKDASQAKQNIDGGSAYLDWLLTRYHDDMALALAAYNAGPGAVDRYHGVPPFPETRAYVARVIREFNRRKLAER